LIESQGRIVMMSSIGGLVAGPLFGPYSGSKFAIEAFTDVLRREVGPLGVRVVAIEPGAIATPIWERGRVAGDERWAAVAPEVQQRYARQVDAVRALADRGSRDGLPAEHVALVVARALTAQRPRTRYLVGRDAVAQAWLSRLLPDRAMDALVRRAVLGG
jgi:NAD(P)-dependent dehydrogenase (short-subunit alcohol dehydrogenase family)